MADSSLVQISIRGGNVAIINQSVFAALIQPPNGATWIASAGPNGTIRFTDQASGLVLSVPDTNVGTQAQVTPPGAPVAASSWIVTEFSDGDGDDPSPTTDPTQLNSGYYTLQEPSTGEYLSRNRIEDYSLMPKRVALQAQDSPGQFELIIRVVD